MEFLQENAGLILAIVVISILVYVFLFRRGLFTQPVDRFGVGPVARGFFRSRKQMRREMNYFQKEFGSLVGQLRNEWNRACRLQVLDEIWTRFNAFLTGLKQALQEVGLKISEFQDLQKDYQAKLAAANKQLGIFRQAKDSGLADDRDLLYLEGTAHSVGLYEKVLTQLASLLTSSGKVSKMLSDIVLRIEINYQFYQQQRDVLATIHMLTDELRGLADDWKKLDVRLSDEIWADFEALRLTLEDLAEAGSQAIAPPTSAIQTVSINDASDRASALAEQLKSKTQSVTA